MPENQRWHQTLLTEAKTDLPNSNSPKVVMLIALIEAQTVQKGTVGRVY